MATPPEVQNKCFKAEEALSVVKHSDPEIFEGLQGREIDDLSQSRAQSGINGLLLQQDKAKAGRRCSDLDLLPL